MAVYAYTSTRPAASGPVSGFDWSGLPGGVRRYPKFSSPQSNGLLLYPATYIWKVFQRQQVSSRSDSTRYYTNFFYGIDGAFVDGINAYYGCHPFPVPSPTGNGKMEISIRGTDVVTRDDATEPYMAVNRWYSHGFVCSNPSGDDFNHKFYVDLPSTANVDVITYNFTDSGWFPGYPASNALIWGGTTDNVGVSWGGFADWEEQNAIIRGVQVYNAALSQTDIIALAALEQDAAVLSYCSSHSITSLWYLNMNWLLADINDKSGGGHHFSWDGAGRPTQYTA